MNKVSNFYASYLAKIEDYAENAPLPEAAFCSRCQKITDVTDKLIAASLEYRGITPSQARCTCAENEAEAAKVLRRDSNLPWRSEAHMKTLQTFKYDDPKNTPAENESLRQAWAIASNFVTNKWASPFLTFLGDYGTGKSHLLEAIGWAFLSKNIKVRFEAAPELLDDLRESEGEGQGSERAAYYMGVSVLLIDELEKARTNAFAQERLDMIVNNRYRHHMRTVFAMNVASQQELGSKLGGAIADRIFDTRTDMCQQVWLITSSWRTE